MAQIAFRYNVPQYLAANLGAFIDAGQELAQRLRRDIPIGRIDLLDVTKADGPLVVASDLVTGPAFLLSTSTYLHRVVAAGTNATTVAVTGAIVTSKLLSAIAIKDADQTVNDATAEYVANAPTAGHFSNLGGTNFTGYHVEFTFYNPPQTEAAVGAII